MMLALLKRELLTKLAIINHPVLAHEVEKALQNFGHQRYLYPVASGHFNAVSYIVHVSKL